MYYSDSIVRCETTSSLNIFLYKFFLTELRQIIDQCVFNLKLRRFLGNFPRHPGLRIWLPLDYYFLLKTPHCAPPLSQKKIYFMLKPLPQLLPNLVIQNPLLFDKVRKNLPSYQNTRYVFKSAKTKVVFTKTEMNKVCNLHFQENNSIYMGPVHPTSKLIERGRRHTEKAGFIYLLWTQLYENYLLIEWSLPIINSNGGSIRHFHRP